MMKALVTGGTGFLGRHVVELLLARGESLRVLARGPAPGLSRLGGPGQLELRVGDVARCLEGAPPLEEAFVGVDRVYHLAGFVSRDPDDGQRMMRVHVDGTHRVFTAAAAAGVKRVVMASTSGTIAVSRKPEPICDETAPYPTEIVSGWPYYLSKIYQEKLAIELAERLKIELVIVNPSLLFGPGDARQSSTTDVRRFLRREIPVIPSGGVSFVDVRDAAAATLAAMEHGRAGERYLLGGPNWSCAEFFGRLERASKVRGPLLKLPPRFTERAAGLMEHAYRALHRDPPVDRISVEMGQVYWYCDSAKATRELGFCPREPGETLNDTIRDCRARMI